MNLRICYLVGAMALGGSTLAFAQAAQQAAPTVAPQTPAKTKTTTTQSTSTTAAVPDVTGASQLKRPAPKFDQPEHIDHDDRAR